MKKTLQHDVFKWGLILGIVLSGFSCMEDSGFNILWEGMEVEFDEAVLPNGSIQKM